MTDYFDDAARTELLQRSSAIDAHGARSRRQALVAAARASAASDRANECCDCGDPIPAKRRKAVPGCIRCTTCETRRQARERLTR